MVPTDDARQIRPVDLRHVENLKKEYKRFTTSFVVPVGLLTDPAVDLSKLTEERVTQIETLGGNHTRVAIQDLVNEHAISDGGCLVKVRLYRDLTDIEALKTGYLHNKQADQSKPMTFMDRVRILRPLVEGIAAKSTELTARKAKIRLIFDLNNIKERNNNFKTRMTIARARSELYSLALEVEKRWDGWNIIRQPKKVELIRQTRFSTFKNRQVPKEEKGEALRVLLRDGLKSLKNS